MSHIPYASCNGCGAEVKYEKNQPFWLRLTVGQWGKLELYQNGRRYETNEELLDFCSEACFSRFLEGLTQEHTPSAPWWRAKLCGSK